MIFYNNNNYRINFKKFNFKEKFQNLIIMEMKKKS